MNKSVFWELCQKSTNIISGENKTKNLQIIKSSITKFLYPLEVTILLQLSMWSVFSYNYYNNDTHVKINK